MLSCDSNDQFDKYVGVEPLIPFVVGEVMLKKTVKCHFLFIHDYKWVMILCLGYYVLLNKDLELEWTIACDCSVPIGIMLHHVRQYIGALTSHHWEALSYLFLFSGYPFTVGAPFILVLGFLVLVEHYSRLDCCLVGRFINFVYKHCQLSWSFWVFFSLYCCLQKLQFDLSGLY